MRNDLLTKFWHKCGLISSLTFHQLNFYFVIILNILYYSWLNSRHSNVVKTYIRKWFSYECSFLGNLEPRKEKKKSILINMNCNKVKIISQKHLWLQHSWILNRNGKHYFLNELWNLVWIFSKFSLSSFIHSFFGGADMIIISFWN